MAKKSRDAATAEQPEHAPTLNTVYFLNRSSNSVFLQIDMRSPGDSCTTDILLDDDKKIEGQQGAVPATELGSNKDLNGKSVLITTTMTNVLGQQDTAQVDISLMGGVMAEKHTLKDVIKKGETTIFVSVVRLKRI